MTIPVRKDGPPKGMTFRPPRPKVETSEERRERHRFYGRKAWQNARLVALNAQPYCAACLKNDLFTPSTDVHHRIDLKDAPELAFELENLECLCHECHSQITNRRQNRP